jgi:hypothetical protein
MSEEKPWYSQWWNTRIIVETLVVIVLLTVGYRLLEEANILTLPENVDVFVNTALGLGYMFFRIKQSGAKES